jgi:hypothetical protein
MDNKQTGPVSPQQRANLTTQEFVSLFARCVAAESERDRLAMENVKLRAAWLALEPMFDNDSALLAVYAAEIEQARAALKEQS